MSNRKLFIAAYDVCEGRRLRNALYVLKGYATGGQKSVFECFLTDAERRRLLSEIRGVLDLDEDRFMLLPLFGAEGVKTLGVAVPPGDPDFYYVG